MTAQSSDRYVLRANGGILCTTNNILLGSSGRRVFTAENGVEIHADCNLISASGRRRGLHDVMAEHPGFVDADRGLYWRSADSPARGLATEDIMPPVDFFGRERERMLDVGAFQYGAHHTRDRRVLDPSPVSPDCWLTNVTTPP